MAQKHKFDLPRNIERYLAALSKLYGQEGERLLQKIIVNAQARVHEEWSYDNLNGGTWGHALYLVVPDTLYLAAAKKKDKLEKTYQGRPCQRPQRPKRVHRKSVSRNGSCGRQ
jgi:hypothetical protein